ncbi:PREDICTED: probable G-protein coupled receptor 148 [Condylura cristata]|uniref:probable G-protein coupled receptor 148 n=1 Tax=Condylura cristata TaxID=143302 RepID=UPI0003343B01|nr:PREDICTED: probable G-protein coupled receptor 148 [Condylura cristata]
MSGQLAPGPQGTAAWPASRQFIGNSPSMPPAASNVSLSLRDHRVPISMLRWLFVPSGLLAAATLALSPLLLVTILRSHRLRREPHYLLLANILLSDLAYVTFHMLISSSSLGGWAMGRIACGVLTDAAMAAYNSTILSFTTTVLHTYLAVAHPLRYLSFMSCKAARKTVALIWLVACLFPTFLIWFSKRQDTRLVGQGASCVLQLSLESQLGRSPLVTVTYSCILCILFLCLALISYCFWRIYAEARTSRILIQDYSRARGTLFIHTVLITLYASPAVVFSLDVVLTKYHHIGARAHMWLMAANSEVFMMLPRAMLPYMYTLRYRQLLATVQGHFSFRRHSDIFTIFQSYRPHWLAS